MPAAMLVAFLSAVPLLASPADDLDPRQRADADAVAIATDHLRVPLGSPVSIGWQANVPAPGGEFVLLSGSDPNALAEVVRLRADRENRVRIVDRVLSSGSVTYELRFVDHHGREQVLATRNISLEVISSGLPGAPISAGSSTPALLTTGLEVDPPSERDYRSLRRTAQIAVGADEPPTPPPDRIG